MGKLLQISPSGTITALQGRTGFNPLSLGVAEVHRSSEIEWDAKHQKWFVQFTELGGVKNYRLDGDVYADHLKGTMPDADGWTAEGVRLFDDYQAAVDEEVRVIERLRVKYGSTYVR